MALPNVIFLSFDDRMEVFARACLTSIKRNYPKHPLLMIHYDGCNADTLSFLQSRDRVQLVSTADLAEIPAVFPPGPVGHRVVYRKYAAWSDLFNGFDKVLYLDVDLLVLRPLDELFASDDFVAVANREFDEDVRIFPRDCWNDAPLLAKLAEDAIPLPTESNHMCNAGVLLVPKRFRTQAQLQRLLDITHRYGHYLQYADQSAISLWCMVNGLELCLKFEYNFQACFFGSDLAHSYSLNTIRVLHFTSSKKPNTLEFMMWPRLPKDVRWTLARLFNDYAQT